MAVFLDYFLAWLAAFGMAAVVLRYVARMCRQRWQDSRFALSFDMAMHRLHKPAGVTIVAAGLAHGLLSPTKVASVNLGTIVFVLALLMALLFVLRRILKPRKGWMRIHRLLAIVTATVLVCHIVEVGGIQVFRYVREAWNARGSGSEAALVVPGPTSATIPATSSPAETTPEASSPAKTTPETTSPAETTDGIDPDPTPGTTVETAGGLCFDGTVLADGIYTGTAEGYSPGLTVEVVVTDGLVASVTVTGHNEVSSRFYTRPIDRIPDEIVAAQSLEVDTVAGATFTSIGILNAVRDALLDAVVSGALPEALTLPAIRRH